MVDYLLNTIFIMNKEQAGMPLLITSVKQNLPKCARHLGRLIAG
jgi:hypothetical protein